MLLVSLLEVLVEVDLCGNWDFEGFVLGDDTELVADSAFGLLLVNANADRDLSGHTRGDDTMLELLNDNTLINTRLNGNPVADRVFILEGKYYFVVSSCSHSTKHGLAGHHVKRAFQGIVEDTSHHRVSLVDELSEGLLLVDGS